MKTGIINYNSGNYASVFNALVSLTDQIKTISSASDFDECDRIVLPGVGAFKSAFQKLEEMSILDVLREDVLQKKKPFLGICVGMQILADRGFEFGVTEGLGFVSGDVVRFEFARDSSLRLPHVGWNSVVGFEKNPLFDGIVAEESEFYFVNSYHLVSKDEKALFSYTEYGYSFISALQKDNIFGVQFHPEKSQRNGLKLLKNFLRYA